VGSSLRGDTRRQYNRHPTYLLRQNDLTPLDLIAAETGRGLAVWADDGRLSRDRDAEVGTATRIDGFSECDKPLALRISAPNGEVPLCRRTKIQIVPRRFYDALHFLFEGCPVTISLELQVLRGRVSAAIMCFKT
jgi:hypothetical protein